MKKLLITALALASFSFMNAQEDEIRFGAKAGLNISNFAGDDVDDADLDSKIGFHVGAVAEIPISDAFAFQPELLFSTQGAKSEEGDIEFTSTINYITIPLMVKYYVAEGLSLQAGPQIGFLVSANDKLEGAGEFNFDEDAKDDYKSIDFGLNLGLGYQLEMGLFFDARYNLGLANIADYDDGNLKNTNIQISLGYKF